MQLLVEEGDRPQNHLGLPGNMVNMTWCLWHVPMTREALHGLYYETVQEYSFYQFFGCMYSNRVYIIFHLHLPWTWLNNLGFWLVMAVLMFNLSGFLNGKKGMRQQICKRRLISLRRVRQISPARFALGNVLPNHKASGKCKFRLGYPCLNIWEVDGMTWFRNIPEYILARW